MLADVVVSGTSCWLLQFYSFELFYVRLASGNTQYAPDVYSDL